LCVFKIPTFKAERSEAIVDGMLHDEPDDFWNESLQTSLELVGGLLFYE
jgi:hypothetical protein